MPELEGDENEIVLVSRTITYWGRRKDITTQLEHSLPADRHINLNGRILVEIDSGRVYKSTDYKTQEDFDAEINSIQNYFTSGRVTQEEYDASKTGIVVERPE